jgi:cell division septum initiation protein DivIVA
MASDHPTDVLPILADAHRGFDAAIRGYDRAQVDEHLNNMDEELRAAARERDSIAARSADLAAQLASTQAQVESLRRQLRAATEGVTADNVDERVRQMLDAARAEATTTLAAAEAEVQAMQSGADDAVVRTKAVARAEADEILAEATERHVEADEMFRKRLAEAEQYRADVEADLAESLKRTHAEEDRLTAEADAERNRMDAEHAAERARLDAESVARRKLAEEDFEITLRLRRTAEVEVSERLKAEAEAKAAQMVADAEQEVRRLIGLRDDAQAQLRQLHDRLGEAIEAAAPDALPSPFD